MMMKIEVTMTQSPIPSLLSSAPRCMNTNKHRENMHVADRTQYQKKIYKFTLPATIRGLCSIIPFRHNVIWNSETN